MQKELSFILLVIAGVILLALIIFSLRARWSKRYQQTPEVGQIDDLMDDKFDVITKSPHNSEQNYGDLNSRQNSIQLSQQVDPVLEQNQNSAKATSSSGWVTKSRKAIKSKEPITKESGAKQRKASDDNYSKPEKQINTVKPAPEYEVIVKKKEPIQEAKIKQAHQIIIFTILPKQEESDYSYNLEKKTAKFFGYELFQTLLAAKLCYGAMSIFHRHEKDSGEGKVLFSLAQLTEPGIFDINNMGACECTGLILFMQLTGPEHNLKNFELMLQTATQIAEDLNGVLADGRRQELQQSVIDKYRKQVAYHANQYHKIKFS